MCGLTPSVIWEDTQGTKQSWCVRCHESERDKQQDMEATDAIEGSQVASEKPDEWRFQEAHNCTGLLGNLLAEDPSFHTGRRGSFLNLVSRSEHNILLQAGLAFKFKGLDPLVFTDWEGKGSGVMQYPLLRIAHGLQACK